MTATTYQDTDLATYPEDPNVWTVTCRPCGLIRTRLGERHAQNAAAKHNRENHAEPVLNLSEAARSYLHYTDQGSRSVFHALTGLNDAEAVAYARTLADAPEDVTAHVAPF